MAVLHFLLVLVLFNLAQACIDDEDCSLLGRCKAGVCACNKGWTGHSCARADLEPLDVKLGYHKYVQSAKCKHCNLALVCTTASQNQVGEVVLFRILKLENGNYLRLRLKITAHLFCFNTIQW